MNDKTMYFGIKRNINQYMQCISTDIQLKPTYLFSMKIVEFV